MTYTAAEGQRVTISGGREIHGWKGSDGFWTLELPDVKAGKWFFRQLYVDGKRMPRGRYPGRGKRRVAQHRAGGSRFDWLICRSQNNPG